MRIADYDTARPLWVMSFTGTKVCVRCLVRPIKREDAIGSVTIGRAEIEHKPAWNTREVCLVYFLHTYDLVYFVRL